MRRRAAKVDRAHVPIVEGLRDAGALVQSLAPVGKGCPDLLVCYRRDLTLLEIKAPLGSRGGRSEDGQKLGEDQMRFIRRGWPVHVVRTLAEALEAVGAVREADAMRMSSRQRQASICGSHSTGEVQREAAR